MNWSTASSWLRPATSAVTPSLILSISLFNNFRLFHAVSAFMGSLLVPVRHRISALWWGKIMVNESTKAFAMSMKAIFLWKGLKAGKALATQRFWGRKQGGARECALLQFSITRHTDFMLVSTYSFVKDYCLKWSPHARFVAPRSKCVEQSRLPSSRAHHQAQSSLVNVAVV